jgi:hypothetical protein
MLVTVKNRVQIPSAIERRRHRRVTKALVTVSSTALTSRLAVVFTAALAVSVVVLDSGMIIMMNLRMMFLVTVRVALVARDCVRNETDAAELGGVYYWLLRERLRRLERGESRTWGLPYRSVVWQRGQ